MKLLSLEFRNIGSYGNKLHQIEFDTGSSDLILIQGKNGNGKCFLPDTSLEIKLENMNDDLKKEFLSFIKNKRKNGNGKLFEEI